MKMLVEGSGGGGGGVKKMITYGPHPACLATGRLIELDGKSSLKHSDLKTS